MYDKSIHWRFWLLFLCLVGALFLLSLPSQVNALRQYLLDNPAQSSLFTVQAVSAIGDLIWEEILVFGTTFLNIAPALLLAAVLGGLFTYRRTLTIFEHELFQAHILLSVSGALMMLIVGNELVRAFGLMGAASIVRYRSKLRDPRDASMLIIALGIGMATGAQLYALAASAAVVVTLFSQGLNRLTKRSNGLVHVTRPTTLRIRTTQPETMLARSQKLFAQREIPVQFQSYRLLSEKTAQDEPVYQLVYTLRLDTEDTRFECTSQLSHRSLVGLEWESKKT
ncbi:MAG: MgtC/SapB family protein [Anaerolineae bacterium]|nr:MgtC/SapB family protein [Anaerolineae bacterium]